MYKIINALQKASIDTQILEVSSHALAQKRLSGLKLSIGIFTNISRDHLDFHPDMNHYVESKFKLFTYYLKRGGVAIINTDDKYGVKTT